MVTGIDGTQQMPPPSLKDRGHRLPHGLPRLLWLPAFGLILSLALSMVLLSTQAVEVPLMHAGEVASQTVRAPMSLVYVDTVATERARQAATVHLPPVYIIDRTSNLAALHTVERLAAPIHQLLASQPASSSQRLAALRQSLEGHELESLVPLLAPLQASQWNRVSAIALDQLRYAADAHNTVTVSTVAQIVAAASRTTGLTGPQRNAVHGLLMLYLNANAQIDPMATNLERHDVLSRVTPITSTVQANQVIVRSGDVADAATVERLQAVRKSALPLSLEVAVGVFLICSLLSLLLHVYAIYFVPAVATSPRRLGVLSMVVIVTISAARLTIGAHDAYAYAFPAAIAPMLVTVLLDPGLGLVTGVIISLLLGQMLGGSFEMTTYYLCGSMLAVLALRRVRKLNQFFVGGLWVSICGASVAIAFQLLARGMDPLDPSAVFLAALISGGLAATLALGSFGALGTVFGVTTALQLLELSHPDHPLLRRLMLRAPGTYHHSLMIGNLAESAAEQIGADMLVARVIAYYHDIGKLESPTYFVENQAAISNIHDSLPPAESARLIRKHVLDGLRLARQYHLPKVIQDGISEHHGVNQVGYFYRQAMQEQPDQPHNVLEFTYPGPKPQSKETAILMLADGVEAACRAVDTSDPEILSQVIHKVVFDRLLDGQLDECSLSLRDLSVIERAFFTVLRGISHPRIKYPENMARDQRAEAKA